jgi:nicotinate-nucleotide adenylyltransferase
MSRIGVFGGSFNPVHVAHLAVAERVRCDRDLDLVLFVPALNPPHKPGDPLASADDRFRMVELATADNEAFRPSRVEIDRGGPSYTLTTVQELAGELGEEAELFLILGADSVRDMPTWWCAEELARAARVIAVPRPGGSLVAHIEAAGKTFGRAWAEQTRELAVDMPLLDVSATRIRERVREGLSVRYLVPEPVGQYIAEHELYTAGG